LASYEFTLELSRDIIDSEAEIIKSTCGDVTIKAIPTGIDTGYTGTLVEFDREAESLEKAIESAMHDIETVADLHATGITIPAPERAEPGAEEADSATVAEAADAEVSADSEPATKDDKDEEKDEKQPSARKATPKKPSTRKAGTRKAAAGKEAPENETAGKRGSADPAAVG
jgi:hypothetical protein